MPLAAHMLIVADAFDAMISERPFRPALTQEAALLEIEQHAGTQFHPVIAKAFVAVQRGQRLEDVLRAEELASIREPAVAPPPRRSVRELDRRPELLVLLGAAVALVGLGVSMPELSLAGGVVAAAGLVLLAACRLSAAASSAARVLRLLSPCVARTALSLAS